MNTGNYFKVCVLSDDSDYGKALAAQVTTGLGGSVDGECSSVAPTADADLKALAQKISAESPDAVYFAGFYPQAASLLQQLRGADVTAAFVSSDGTNVQAFVDQMDTTANGTTLSCGCAPAPDAFVTAYQAAVNHETGRVFDRVLRPGHGAAQGHRCRKGRPFIDDGIRPFL